MNRTEKNRRVAAGRTRLIGAIGLLQLEGDPSAAEMMAKATAPRLRYKTFQALRQQVTIIQKNRALYGSREWPFNTTTGRALRPGQPGAQSQAQALQLTDLWRQMNNSMAEAWRLSSTTP